MHGLLGHKRKEFLQIVCHFVCTHKTIKIWNFVKSSFRPHRTFRLLNWGHRLDVLFTEHNRIDFWFVSDCSEEMNRHVSWLFTLPFEHEFNKVYSILISQCSSLNSRLDKSSQSMVETAAEKEYKFCYRGMSYCCGVSRANQVGKNDPCDKKESEIYHQNKLNYI